MPRFYKLNRVFKERERVERLSLIRELIFGAQDGLIAPLAIVFTVAGAFANNGVIIITGISAALGGALTLGTGTYLASQAERQLFRSEIRKEKGQITRSPAREREELILLFRSEGLKKEDAELVVDKILTSKKSFQNTQIQKELGLDPNPIGSPEQDAIYTAIAALITSMIPLAPFFFLSPNQAIYVSATISLFSLFIIGMIKGKVADVNMFTSGLQVFIIGATAGIGGYFLGKVLPHVFNIPH